MKWYPRRAFTLIELLIVVAIIAILALIAVPNFLEAQTRSKVSRVKSDMRTVSIAWEAYHVDWNSYPEDQDDTLGASGEFGYRQVTTPVAYITSIPTDPFPDTHLLDTSWEGGIAHHFEIASAQAWKEPYDAYAIASDGPDHDENFGGDNDRWPGGHSTMWAYDPTNGTISRGDIMRFGGQYRAGSWDFNGIPWQQWGTVGPVVP